MCRGIRQLLARNEQLFSSGQIREADVLAVRAKLEMAELQVRESKQAKIKANRALALMLNMPLERRREARGPRPHRPAPRTSPCPGRSWSGRPSASGPTCWPSSWASGERNADIQLAKANAYPDVYVLYQPYTFQNNTYLGVPSAYSWTLGVTATIPLYNRNQGNITRAKINMDQTQIQAASLERTVVSDVLNAAQELEQSLISVAGIPQRDHPGEHGGCATRPSQLYDKGETSVLDYLEAQLAFNDVVKQYRDALVRHRRAILDLNTAVGERILP